MKPLLILALGLASATTFAPTVSRRLADLEGRETAAIEKAQREISALRKSAGAEMMQHSNDLIAARDVESAAVAKRIADRLNEGKPPLLEDWIKGRKFYRDMVPDDPAKPFAEFTADGTALRLPWGEKAKVEAIGENKVVLKGPTGRLQMQVAADRTYAAVMLTRDQNDVWLLKPLPLGK